MVQYFVKGRVHRDNFNICLFFLLANIRIDDYAIAKDGSQETLIKVHCNLITKFVIIL